MSRVFGIDVRENHVRIAVLQAGYRKLQLEALAEEVRAGHESLSAAISACVAKLPHPTPDTIVVALDGSRVFSHRLRLPESARKRLGELLPFELEAVLPVDVDELVIDSKLLPNEKVELGQELSLLAVAARAEHVSALLDTVQDALGRQAERVGVSSTELGHLVHIIPDLKSDEAVALVDFGYESTDVCITRGGVSGMLRTISSGVDGFPQTAGQAVNALRQTFSAYAAQTGFEVQRLVILGEGAVMNGLGDFLSSQLDVTAIALPAFTMEGLTPEDAERVPAFARALGAAVHGVRGRGLDLRQGPLAFERGYEHLKARAPLSATLLALVLLSFLFSVWAESLALANEKEALLESLSEVTKSTFGTSTEDPDEAEVALATARKVRPEDPMRYLDGFGLAVVLADKLPQEIKHDLEEFDFDQGKDLSAGKLKLRGQVNSTEEAQKIAQLLNEHRCIDEAKVTKITQVVNSERERYQLEAAVECPEDPSAGKSKKKSKSGDSQ